MLERPSLLASGPLPRVVWEVRCSRRVVDGVSRRLTAALRPVSPCCVLSLPCSFALVPTFRNSMENGFQTLKCRIISILLDG